MNFKKIKLEEGNNVSSDNTKSIEYNLNKVHSAKSNKDKIDFKYQNFSQAVNLIKSHDNKNKILAQKKKTENHQKNVFLKESKEIKIPEIIQEETEENFVKNLNLQEVNKINKNDFDLNKNFNKLENQNLTKQSNCESIRQRKQSLKDCEISEYSITNAHFSREEDQRYYMKFEKNIQFKNNNIMTKLYANKHFTCANGPYKMDIKPMLGKIKEIQEYNFENNFNIQLNLNEKRKNFESVNFENLRNLNLEKIESQENFVKKSSNFTFENECYNGDKINFNDQKKNRNVVQSANFLTDNKPILYENLGKAFEINKYSEAEFNRNLMNLEDLDKDLDNLNIQENDNSNNDINNLNDLHRNVKSEDINDNIISNYLKNGGSSFTDINTLPTSQNKNEINNLNKNGNFDNIVNLKAKKAQKKSLYSDSNLSNGITPISSNKELENILLSKESSKENIIKDKDFDFNTIKREYNNSLSNGKNNQINSKQNQYEKNFNLHYKAKKKIPINKKEQIILSNFDFDSNPKNEQISYFKSNENINHGNKQQINKQMIQNNTICNNRLLYEDSNSFSNCTYTGKKPQNLREEENSNLNMPKKIESLVKIISIEKQNKENNSNSNIKSKTQIIIEENIKNTKETNQIVNGGGVSNGNFKVYGNNQSFEIDNSLEINNNKKIEIYNKKGCLDNNMKNCNYNSNKNNISFNSSFDKNSLIHVTDISKSQNIKSFKFSKLGKLKEKNSEAKNKNNDSETKFMGDDILEDLDEIKDLDVDIKLTKSHKFPKRITHKRKKSERKLTVSDIDLSSMRESYYNSKILNLNTSSTFNPTLDAGVSRNHFFSKFQKKKNSQKNILILDSNMTEQGDESINLLSQSLSIISKKNVSNFERMDKIKFNQRKNSKHMKTSFLSSFQNLNNISSQRIKKAFFYNNMENLFYDNNNQLEMNSFLTVQNKSNLNNTNNLLNNINTNYDYSNTYNKQNNIISNNEQFLNNNNHNNISMFYNTINISLSKIILKNNNKQNDRKIQNINELVMLIEDNNQHENRLFCPTEIKNNNLIPTIANFENNSSEKNYTDNLMTDKNFDCLLNSERENLFPYNGELILYNNSDKTQAAKTTNKIKSNDNILIYENYEKNESEMKNKICRFENENKNDIINSNNQISMSESKKQDENLNHLKNIKNILNYNNNDKICSNNEILEISNFLNLDYNSNNKEKEQIPQNFEMENNEIKIERVNERGLNTIPNFNFYNSNLKTQINNSLLLSTLENNNSLRNNYNKSLRYTQINSEENIAKETNKPYNQIAADYNTNHLNEFSKNSYKDMKKEYKNKKNSENYDLPQNYMEKQNLKNSKNKKEILNNKKNSDTDTNTNYILDLDYESNSNSKDKEKSIQGEKNGYINIDRNFTQTKRARPNGFSPYISNSQIIISIDKTNSNLETNKPKINIQNNTEINQTFKNRQDIKKNYINDKIGNSNINNIKNDTDDIIDLNSLGSPSPQYFDDINNFENNKSINSKDFIDHNNQNGEMNNSRLINYNLKQLQSPKKNIEIRVDQGVENFYETSINKEKLGKGKQESLEIKNEERNIGYFTPEKANKLRDSNNLLKIRNHNKISTNSLLKNSNMALYYSQGISKKEFYNNDEEQLQLFFENNQGQMHNIYDLDFINNLLDKEHKFQADENYFSNHPHLTHEHRAILVDWMMEICEDLAFKRDTLHFAVNYLDRFLSKTENIEKNILQLIGVACLCIAGKFEVL